MNLQLHLYEDILRCAPNTFSPSFFTKIFFFCIFKSKGGRKPTVGHLKFKPKIMRHSNTFLSHWSWFNSIQTWEGCNKCGQGGQDGIKRGIVQIYQLDENAPYQDDEKVPPKLLKIPLCLGALISFKHVLSTKLCFGEFETDKAAIMPFKQKGSSHLRALKLIFFSLLSAKQTCRP